MADDQKELIQDFLFEGEEQIVEIESLLVGLENRRDKTESLNLLFRLFHTLKGNASWLKLDNIHHICHELEGTLGKIRSGALSFDEKFVTISLEAVDSLKKQLKGLEQNSGNLPSIEGIINKIHSLQEKKMEEHPQNVESIKSGFLLIENFTSVQLDIDVYKNQPFALIRVKGKMDYKSTDFFLKQIDDFLKEDTVNVVCDMGEITFISSAALGVVATSCEDLKKAGGALKLCSLDDNLMSLFELTGLDRVIDIYPDLDSAIGAFL